MFEFWKKYNNIFALLLALFAAYLVTGVVEGIGHAIYPPAEKLDYNNPELMRNYVESLPFGSLLIIVIAYSLSAGVGAFCATYFADVSKRWPMYIFFIIYFGTVVATFIAMPYHPIWMMLASCLGMLAFTALGFNLAAAQKRKKIQEQG